MKNIFYFILAITTINAFAGDSSGGSGGTQCQKLFSELNSTVAKTVFCKADSDCKYMRVEGTDEKSMWLVFLGNDCTDLVPTQEALDRWVAQCAVPANIACGVDLPSPKCVNDRCANTGASYCLNPSPE